MKARIHGEFFPQACSKATGPTSSLRSPRLAPNHFNTVFFNPGNQSGASIVNNNDSFAANVIRVYAGDFNFTDNTLGEGGLGATDAPASAVSATALYSAAKVPWRARTR